MFAEFTFRIGAGSRGGRAMVAVAGEVVVPDFEAHGC